MYEPRWDPTITSDARCEIIREYVRKYPFANTFVETGTNDGLTCNILHKDFAAMHTIEIVPTLYQGSKQRLARYPHVHCYQGDSTDILPGLLKEIASPCLFWLDGHYCGSLEARAEIFATGLPHVVLVDDSRLFGRDPAYPTVEWVRDIAVSQDIEFLFSYEDDIMRLVPR
jgi:hypothetical protein